MIREIFILWFIIVSVLLAGCITDRPPEKATIQLTSSGMLPENATIQLTSSPSGAEIFFDNESRGTTPVMIMDIEPGNHSLEYRMKGFASWRDTITVPSGTSHFFTALTAEPAPQQTITITPTATTATPVRVTIKVSKAQMIVTDTIMFSGTATGTGSVSLTLFGPGKYADGVILDKVTPNAAGAWSYTWSPGSKTLSGIYTIVVNDQAKTASENVQFTVIGNGDVIVTTNSYSIDRGDTLTIFGRCTTNAPSVKLTLFGPGKYISGVVLSTVSVTSDDTWSFRYPTDKTMPAGIYTISVSDVPETTTGKSQFSVGFAS